MTTLVDSTGAPLRSVTVDRKPRSEFMRGARAVTMGGWSPALRPIQDDVRNAWAKGAARTIDTMQNVGWVAGALQQAIANTVGNGLRLNAMPDPEALGMTEAQASELARKIERRFRTYSSNAYECDIEGRRSFGLQQAAFLLNFFAFGEGLAEIVWRRRPGASWATKVKLIEPFRLSQKNDPYRRLAQGVEQDQDGLPVAYLIESDDPWMGKIETRVPARYSFGRQRIVHSFDGMVGQVRGISPLVPALGVARQYDQLANATTMAAIIQSVFAAAITSEQPTQEVLEALTSPQERAQYAQAGMSPYDAWFEAQAGWYERTHINVGVAGRIAHLFPGQKLEFLKSEAATVNPKDFATILLREMARAIGITYEGMTGDYAGVTFSSVRMATDEIFRIILYRRQNIIAPFCQAVYEAWLEEEIDRGTIEIPGGLETFMQRKADICRAEWKGSPKPQADDLKTAKAHEVWSRLGVMSNSTISSDLGLDYEDTVAELAREREMRAAAKLPEPVPASGSPAADEDEDEGSETSSARKEE